MRQGGEVYSLAEDWRELGRIDPPARWGPERSGGPLRRTSGRRSAPGATATRRAGVASCAQSAVTALLRLLTAWSTAGPMWSGREVCLSLLLRVSGLLHRRIRSNGSLTNLGPNCLTQPAAHRADPCHGASVEPCLHSIAGGRNNWRFDGRARECLVNRMPRNSFDVHIRSQRACSPWAPPQTIVRWTRSCHVKFVFTLFLTTCHYTHYSSPREQMSSDDKFMVMGDISGQYCLLRHGILRSKFEASCFIISRSDDWSW